MPVEDIKLKRDGSEATEVAAIAEAVVRQQASKPTKLLNAGTFFPDTELPGSGRPARQFSQTPAGAGMTYGTLGGTVNGINTTFTVPEGSYTSSTIKVYLNGQLVSQGSDITPYGWVETDPSAGTFDFNVAPPTGSHIIAEYEV